MKTLRVFMPLMIVILMLTACGGSAVQKPEDQGMEVVVQPEWWRLQNSETHLYYFGQSGDLVSSDLVYDDAFSKAIAEAAIQKEAYVKALLENYKQEAGVTNPQVTSQMTRVLKVVAAQKIQGAAADKQVVYRVPKDVAGTPQDRYRCYVRVSIPKEKLHANMVDQIRNEEALYNEFKASQGFKRLEQEVDQLRNQ